MTFWAWKQVENVDDLQYELLGTADRELDAEAIALKYVCDRPANGTYESIVTNNEGIDVISIRRFFRRGLGLIWVGQPGDWNGNNGTPAVDICPEPSD